MSFKQNRILMMTFVETQFGVMSVHEFITKGNSYEDNIESHFQVMWVDEFHRKWIFMEAFVDFQFEVL